MSRPALTVLSVHLADEDASKETSGIKATQLWVVTFRGMWNPVGCVEAAAAAGLPSYGFAHDVDATLWCNSTKAVLAPESMPYPDLAADPNAVGVAHITATFQSYTVERRDLPPTSRPYQISGGGSDIKEARRYDVDNKPIINSAGQFYDDIPEFFVRASEVSVTMNVTANPAVLANTYSNSVNNGTWYGIDAGWGKMGKITYVKKYEKWETTEYTYYEITFPIQINRNGWKLLPISHGTSYLDGSGKLVPYIDKYGANSPCFLDASGHPIIGDAAYIASNAIIYPTAGYKALDETDWGSLPIASNPFT